MIFFPTHAPPRPLPHPCPTPTLAHVTHVILITPFGVNEPQEMEQENDAIHYSKVYSTSIKPELKKSIRYIMNFHKDTQHTICS